MAILDQVRKNQFQEKISMFNPVETLNTLFSYLSEKEKDIIRKRFGLGTDKKFTLEEIGSHYGITRERIRQIENLSINKLKQIQELKDEILDAEKVITGLIEQYGGVMEEQFFLENILNYLNNHPDSESALLFLAEHIFTDNVSKVRQDKEFNNLWKTGTAEIDWLKEIISQMVAIIEGNNAPVNLQELLESFKNSDFYTQNKSKIMSSASFLEATDEDINKILESYLRSSRKIKQDLFGQWGLVSWGIVQPKKINDKIYITLKKAGKPLHFVEIAEKINENKFDEKIAYPPTVHNELILDKKYVLVGRGIYALKEWGYKPGNVADVIEDLLRENGPMAKEAIISGVLERRNVKKSTIYLSLMNNKNIEKLKDGKYAIKSTEQEA